MTLAPGTKLHEFEILDRLGTGGMGAVYRARDTKLERDVAVKVLLPELSRDEGRLERFQREAKLLAQINHANIATVHGLEELDGRMFLVMELVEGETLAERIARGRLSAREARTLFVQIADGLQVAHEKGIVHRDLKPANIKVAPDGVVKILDFGLAKAFSPSEDVSAEMSQSPTLTKDTALGVILGTAAYMSPEQARGKPVDARTDVWAFGACLYEAVTGKRPFDGETVADVIGAVVHKEPDWSPLPSSFETLVRRCLTKDVRRRLQAIGDARFELEETGSPSEASTSKPRLGALALGVALGAALVAAVAWSVWPSATPKENVVPRRLTSNPIENSVTTAAISADGRYLAFLDDNGLFVRLVETGETHAIATPEGFDVEEVDWYPDGSSLLLGAIVDNRSSLWRVSVLGGEPRRLGDGARASLAPDGARIAYLVGNFPQRRLFLMGGNGEDAHEILSATEGSSFSMTAWSPNGDWVLVGRLDSNLFGASIEAVRSDGSETRSVLANRPLFQSWTGALPFVWTSDDRLIVALREDAPNRDSSNLWSAPIDPRTLELIAEPRRITSLSGHNPRDLIATADGKRLSFLLERFQSDVYVSRLESDGARLTSTARLTLDDRDDEPSGWLSDSATVLFESERAGSMDPYRQHLDDRVPTSLHSGPVNARDPQLSADGVWILFFYGNDVMRLPIAGGPPERVWSLREGASWRKLRCAHDARCVFGERDDASQEYVFFALDPVDGKGEELARMDDRPPFTDWGLSPDGTKVAVVHNDGDLRVIDLETGSETELRHERWRYGEFVEWDAHGDGVYMDADDDVTFVGRSFRKQLIYVPLDNERDAQLLRRSKHQWHIRPKPSPDGRYLAYGVVTFSANAWMLEDF